MRYDWLTLNKDFDRSLPITKLRYDVGKTTQYNNENDGYFSELPNINTDGKAVNEVSGAPWGYAKENRFNLYRNYFTNRAGGFIDKMWNTTTLVSGTTYEYDLITTLYYSGLLYYTNTNAAADLEKFQVYVPVNAFSIDKDSVSFTYNSGSTTVDVFSDNPWTASTNDSWITLSQYTGSTNATITVTVPYNQFAERTGTIEFTDGEDTLTLTVIQEANGLIPTNKMFRNGNRIN